MIIKGKEYGFVYDMGVEIKACELLGFEDNMNDLYTKMAQAFESLNKEQRLTLAFAKIATSIVYASVSRYCERNGFKGVTLSDVYELPYDKLAEGLSEVLKLRLENSPKSEEVKGDDIKKK